MYQKQIHSVTVEEEIPVSSTVATTDVNPEPQIWFFFKKTVVRAVGGVVVSPECIHVFQSEKLMHNTTIPYAGDKQAGACGTGQRVRSKQVD